MWKWQKNLIIGGKCTFSSDSRYWKSRDHQSQDWNPQLFSNCFLVFWRLEKGKTAEEMPETELSFEVRVETEYRQACRQIQRALQAYRDEKKGPTLVAVQAQMGNYILYSWQPIQITINVFNKLLVDLSFLEFGKNEEKSVA